jgi:hypothetical protein
MSEPTSSCPCCGKRKPLGLFDVLPALQAPLAVQQALESGVERSEIKEREGLLSFAGRWFLCCDMRLPLGRFDSPLGMRVWIELSAEQIEAVQSVRAGERRQASGQAQLACELPGFAGSIGAPCRFRLRSGEREARLITVSDKRLLSIPDDADHEQLAALYRRIWGNERSLVAADPELRAAVEQRWRDLIARAAYTSAVVPPPSLAGTEPPELLVSPPLDTGSPAFMGTIGVAEAAVGAARRVEIAAWINNPSEAVVRCFGEFSYLSRTHNWSDYEDELMHERTAIPDTDGAFTAWLITSPWWIEAKRLHVEEHNVTLLAAIPLHAQEVNYAAFFGVDRLRQELELSDEDLSDLNRGPVISLAHEL